MHDNAENHCVYCILLLMRALVTSSASKLLNFLLKGCMYYSLSIWLAFSLLLAVFRRLQNRPRQESTFSSIQHAKTKQDSSSKPEQRA